MPKGGSFKKTTRRASNGPFAGIPRFARNIMSSAARRMGAGRGIPGNPLRDAISRRLSSLRSTSTAATQRVNSRIQTGKVYNEGTGGQYSYFSGKQGKSFLPPHVENALPPQVIQYNGATQLKSAVGLQAISTPLSLFPPSVATTYTGDKISRVLYEKASGDLTMNNIYLSNCYLIIYDIMARKDLGSGSAVGAPDAAWKQGDTDLSGTGDYTFLGSTPWQSEAFNQFFEVKQVTNVVLAAGATHVHKVRLAPKRVISSAYAQYSGAQFANLTYYCMIEIHGSPANDTTTQTQVSVGVAGLNIIEDSETHIKQLMKATPTLTTTNNLPGSFTVAEQVVNLGGSTIVPQAEG